MTIHMGFYFAIDRGIVKLFSTTFLLFFLAIGLAYAGATWFLLPIFTWAMLMLLFVEIIRNVAVAMALSFFALLGACCYLMMRLPALWSTFADVFVNILELGMTISERIDRIQSLTTTYPLSLDYDLKQRSGEIKIYYNRPEDDPKEIEDAAHLQIRRSLQKQDYETSKSLLKHITDIERAKQDPNSLLTQRPLLHEAAEAGTTELVAKILDRGAEINRIDYVGHTPIHLAAQKGHFETVRLLIDRGANVNAKSEFGATPIRGAVFCDGGHPDVVEMLLDYGADPNEQSYGGGTLLANISRGDPDDKKRLIEDILKNYGGQYEVNY